MTNPFPSSTKFLIHQEAIFTFETQLSAGNKILSNPVLNLSQNSTQESYMKLYIWPAESAFFHGNCYCHPRPNQPVALDEPAGCLSAFAKEACD